MIKANRTEDEIYTIRNIRMEGHEHGQLENDVVYAELVDKDENIVMAATFKQILKTVRNREIPVENAITEYKVNRRKLCSTVHLEIS